jgi:cytochrome c biogenesis protein ResB
LSLARHLTDFEMRVSFTWRAWLGKAWRSLSQLQLGVILLALVLTAIAVGTLFPQKPRGLDTTWWEAVRDRYGFLYGPLRALGLFDLFGALWFQGALGLLLLSTLACFLNRVWPLSRVVFRPRTRLPAERFERAALRSELAFPSAQAAETALRTALGRRRYRVQVERRGDQLYLRADRHRLPRLGTLLTHIGLICLLLGAAWGGLRGWRAPTLAVRSGEVTAVGHGTGVGLRCDRFQILRYDDDTPQDYRADVLIISEAGDELTRGTVRVNHPLGYAGVSYYLQGYRLSEAGTCDVTLSATRDPGYGLVIVAGLFLLFGVTLTFHFPHRRIWARWGPGGEATLVGSTAWDKGRFTQQFEALAAELQGASRQEGEEA